MVRPGEEQYQTTRWRTTLPIDTPMKGLVCFCAPHPCHADTLIEVANS